MIQPLGKFRQRLRVHIVDIGIRRKEAFNMRQAHAVTVQRVLRHRARTACKPRLPYFKQAFAVFPLQPLHALNGLLLRHRVNTGGQHPLHAETAFPRFFQRHQRKHTNGQRLLLAVKTIGHAPILAAVGVYQQIQATAIYQLKRCRPWLDCLNLPLCQFVFTAHF